MLDEDGFTLIEVVVSLLLLSIIVIGFFNAYIALHKFNDKSEKKRLAFQLCQETIANLKRDQIKMDKNIIKINKENMKDYNFMLLNQYDFIDVLLIDKKNLIIQDKLLNDLNIYKIIIKWSNQEFELKTIL